MMASQEISHSKDKSCEYKDENIFEEGDEEDVLDHCFANAARNADIVLRQQYNNKKENMKERLVVMVR